MDEYDQVLSEISLLNAEANEEAVIVYQNELEEEEEKMYSQLVYTYEMYDDYNYEEWN
jgi:hypothetical protein